MQSLRILRISLLLTFLTTLIGILIANLMSWLPHNFYDNVGNAIGYKWLLTIGLILSLSLIFSIIYYRFKIQHLSLIMNKPLEVESINKPISVASEKINERELLKEKKKILKNLADGEKELLRKMLNENKRSDRFSIFNNTVNGLVAIGILFQSSPHIVRYQSTFTISDWAWEMLKEDKAYLK